MGQRLSSKGFSKSSRPVICPTFVTPRHSSDNQDNTGGEFVPLVLQQRLDILDEPNLSMVVDCFEPLLWNIASFIASSPMDIVNFCYLSSHRTSRQVDPVIEELWERLYARRWPAFYDAMRYYRAQEWWKVYRETFVGTCDFILEIFDREKKIGFAMSAMPARVRYAAGIDSYIAHYISAAVVDPEAIPCKKEGHRLRFCPVSARDRLQPGTKQAAQAQNPWLSYPYRVLEGMDGLRVGQPVELQWKMQTFSPFGWWYGELEALRLDSSGSLATATIIFPHFPTDSAWYRLDIRFGDGQMNPCLFGGKTGGIRAVSVEEKQMWMRFMPKKKIVF